MMAIFRKYDEAIMTVLQRTGNVEEEDELKLVVLWKHIIRFLHVSTPKDKVGVPDV